MLENVKVTQIKKFKKQSPFIFEFCFWEDPPHPVNWSPTHSTGPQPIQLVPNPFNWSPKTVFYRNLSIGHSNKKKLKKSPFIFEFCFCEDPPHPVKWSPINSTGPQTLFLQMSALLHFCTCPLSFLCNVIFDEKAF